jgi:plasmid stabilization system protein ParE
MAEVRWTPQAAGDLESITDFIAKDSPHYASLFVVDIFTVESAEKSELGVYSRREF